MAVAVKFQKSQTSFEPRSQIRAVSLRSRGRAVRGLSWPRAPAPHARSPRGHRGGSQPGAGRCGGRVSRAIPPTPRAPGCRVRRGGEQRWPGPQVPRSAPCRAPAALRATSAALPAGGHDKAPLAPITRKPRKDWRKEIPSPSAGVEWPEWGRVGTWGLPRGPGGRGVTPGPARQKLGSRPGGRPHALCLIGGSAQTFLYGVTEYLPVGRPGPRDVTPR